MIYIIAKLKVFFETKSYNEVPTVMCLFLLEENTISLRISYYCRAIYIFLSILYSALSVALRIIL